MLACLFLAGCKPTPSPQSVKDVRVIAADPKYCKKLGYVDGVGGSDRSARRDALELAVARGATHVRLDSAHPDLEDGMTMVVTAKLFRCPPPGEQFPPDGYP
jgi:hypothetical protein